jgi:hypothetical protein
MGVMDSRAKLKGIRFLFLLRLGCLRSYNYGVPKSESDKCSTCGHLKCLHGSDWGCKVGHSELHDGVRRVVVCSCQREFPQTKRKLAA